MKNAFLNICLAFCILWLLVQIAECSFNEDTGNNAYIDTVQVHKRPARAANDTAKSPDVNDRAPLRATFDEGYKEGYESGRNDGTGGHPYRHSYKAPTDERPDYAKGYSKGYDDGYKETTATK